MSPSMRFPKHIFLIVFSVLLLLPHRVSAHPHMFLDAAVTVRANERGVTGVLVEWEFDVWFSASILMDFDFDNNKKFDDYETSEIYDLAFSNLINYNYFTYFTVDDEMIPASEVTEFSVRAEKDKIVYTFFIPFSVPFEQGAAEFSVAVYDKTFFCDVAYVESETARFEGPGNMEMDYTIGVDKGITIEYDNAIVGNGRSGEVYTGVSHPDSIRVVLKK